MGEPQCVVFVEKSVRLGIEQTYRAVALDLFKRCPSKVGKPLGSELLTHD